MWPLQMVTAARQCSLSHRQKHRNLQKVYNTIQYNIRLIRLDKTQTIQYMVIKISLMNKKAVLSQR